MDNLITKRVKDLCELNDKSIENNIVVNVEKEIQDEDYIFSSLFARYKMQPQVKIPQRLPEIKFLDSKLHKNEFGSIPKNKLLLYDYGIKFSIFFQGDVELIKAIIASDTNLKDVIVLANNIIIKFGSQTPIQGEEKLIYDAKVQARAIIDKINQHINDYVDNQIQNYNENLKEKIKQIYLRKLETANKQKSILDKLNPFI